MKDFNRSKEFEKDLQYGNWGEGVMIRFIESFFQTRDNHLSYWYSIDDVQKDKRKLKEWDLRFGIYNKTDRINYTDKVDFEVKTDMYEINTGNLIFEKSSGGKKSGVFATKAKYFIYFLPLFNEHNIYVIKSEKLIELLNNFNTHIVSGGDFLSNTMMYKISRVEFDEKFKEAGGKIITYNDYTIPERFNKEQFKENITTYSSESLKQYEDPFKF